MQQLLFCVCILFPHAFVIRVAQRNADKCRSKQLTWWVLPLSHINVHHAGHGWQAKSHGMRWPRRRLLSLQKFSAYIFCFPKVSCQLLNVVSCCGFLHFNGLTHNHVIYCGFADYKNTINVFFKINKEKIKDGSSFSMKRCKFPHPIFLFENQQIQTHRKMF